MIYYSLKSTFWVIKLLSVVYNETLDIKKFPIFNKQTNEFHIAKCVQYIGCP